MERKTAIQVGTAKGQRACRVVDVQLVIVIDMREIIALMAGFIELQADDFAGAINIQKRGLNHDGVSVVFKSLHISAKFFGKKNVVPVQQKNDVPTALLKGFMNRPALILN